MPKFTRAHIEFAERDEFGTVNAAQRTLEFSRLAHIQDLNGAGVFLKPLRLDFPN